MAGDEVVQHEVVQDDDPRRRLQRLDDPAVRVGVVADVVEGDVAAARGTPAPLRDLDLDALVGAGQEGAL